MKTDVGRRHRLAIDRHHFEANLPSAAYLRVQRHQVLDPASDSARPLIMIQTVMYLGHELPCKRQLGRLASVGFQDQE